MLHSIIQRFSTLPDVVGMHGGLPPPDAFPFTSFSFGVCDGTTLTIDSQPEVACAQQYNLHAKGYPPLQAWAQQLVEELHRPPCPTDTIITPGATCSLDALLRLLLNPGDPLLVEEYTYSHALEALFIPKGYDLCSVPLDHQGLCPKALNRLMEQRQAAGLPLPRVLYTIPVGHNPTGSSTTPERRQEIYQVAQAWGLVILEDDAYFWLQFPDGPEDVPGLKLPGGYLSIDVDGRVVRIDTLAKLLGAGLRLGWVTAAPRVIAKLALIVNGSTIGAATLSQVIVHQLLTQWGRPGFEAFVTKLQKKYAQQAALAAAAAQQHLGDSVELRPCTAGMFLWCKLAMVADADEVLEAGVREQVVVVPGKFFWVDAAVAAAPAAANGNGAPANGAYANGHAAPAVANRGHAATANGHGAAAANGSAAAAAAPAGGAKPCPYFRVSFVSVTPQKLQEGFQRLGAAIRSCCPPSTPPAAAPAGAVGGLDCLPSVPEGGAELGGEASKEGPPSLAALAAAAAGAGGGGEGGERGAGFAVAGRVSSKSLRPWPVAEEGRIRVPSYFLKATSQAPKLDDVPVAEPLEPGIDDQGLSAAAAMAEKAAVAAGEHALPAMGGGGGGSGQQP